MLFKKRNQIKTYDGAIGTYQGMMTLWKERITVDKDNTVYHQYTYSVYHPDHIDDLSPFNALGLKIYNQLTNY